MRLFRQAAGCEPCIPDDAGLRFRRRNPRNAPGGALCRYASVVRLGRLSSIVCSLQWTDRRLEAQGRHDHRRPGLWTLGVQWRRGHSLRAFCRRCNRTPRLGTATPPITKDGSRGPPCWRHRARLQQSLDGDLRLLRISAGATRPRTCLTHARSGDRQRRRTRLFADPPTSRLQPQADAGSKDSRSQQRGDREPQNAQPRDRRGH